MRLSQESCVGGFFQPTFFCAIYKAGLTPGAPDLHMVQQATGSTLTGEGSAAR
jgi:hypothetical protein